MARIVKRFLPGGNAWQDHVAMVNACWREADVYPLPFHGEPQKIEESGGGAWSLLYPSGALVEGTDSTVTVSHDGLVGPYLVRVELQGDDSISEGSVGPFEHREEALAFAEGVFPLWRETARRPACVVPNGIWLERMIRPAELPDRLRRCAPRARARGV